MNEVVAANLVQLDTRCLCSRVGSVAVAVPAPPILCFAPLSIVTARHQLFLPEGLLHSLLETHRSSSCRV